MRVFYLVPHQRVREQPPEQLIAEHFTLPCSRENSDPSDRNRCLPVTPQGDIWPMEGCAKPWPRVVGALQARQWQGDGARGGSAPSLEPHVGTVGQPRSVQSQEV